MASYMNEDVLKKLDCEEISCCICGSNSNRSVSRGYDYEYQTTQQEFTFVQCNNCGHLFLNPRPKITCADLIYPPNYYTLAGRHSADRSKIISFFKNKIILNRLSYFKPFFDKPMSLLEIGCGDCSLLLSLKAKFPHLICHGVDIRFSELHRRACRDIGIELIQGPIETVDLPDNTYDLIIMNQLLEHLWYPEDVIAKIYRVLSKGGMVSIETVDSSGYDRILFSRSFWGGYYFPRHMNLFSDEGLRKLLEQNGFKISCSYSLLAPIVWTFSFHAALSHNPNWLNSILGKFFTDSNPLCLAMFAVIDLIALSIGLTTSNQKIIAKKEGEVAD